MITAFTAADRTAHGAKALFTLLRRNKIRVEHVYCDSVVLKTVTYERYRGRVNWTSVDRFIHSGRGNILCPEGTELPAERGYRRFSSDELDLRLCENAALFLMNNIGYPHVRVALIDDNGDHEALCTYLTDKTDRLTVVTRRIRQYLDEADRLLEEKGAVLSVSKSVSPLKNADLIIAPAPLTRDLNCPDDAVILSSAAPTVYQNAPVIRGYSFELPQKYREMKPDFLDDMYFASAIYTLAGAYELGSSVFRRCFDGASVHTRNSLLEQLKKRLGQS